MTPQVRRNRSAEHGTRRAARATRHAEHGAATVEFVFIGILVLVPLLYLVIAVFEAQRNTFAVTQAAREAGRAFATADDETAARARADAAMRMALADQGLEPTAVLRFVTPTADCTAAETTASLAPGTEFAVCVVRTYRLPAVPSFVDGDNNTITGRYLVHIDDYREHG